MAKNIVLCSDGTGNKGGNGKDSNVYKLYQAIDIHNAKTQQISFYENGVGTKEDGSAVKSNKFWVALSGAFGFGFEDNVRDLYEFLSRHYEVGDQIYIFGFSRGASTVRAFTGYIHSCGLLDKTKTTSEVEFQELINLGLKAYEKINTNPELANDFKQKYAINDGSHAPDANLKIHFIGVWDTVSALGFPDGTWNTSDWFFKSLDKVSKICEKWADKRWPHQFYNYKLNDSILYACQALAIDDERKTFHPKVWDESNRAPGTVEQVWFAGVHSNVGGGYPRTGLSSVALEWMYKHAADKGLIFIADDVNSTRTHANVHGKLYDSRDGLAVYYRYEPRDIEKFCISKSTGQPKIETGKIKIHNTVIERIKQETALYIPGNLPAKFEVVETETDPEKKTESVSFDKDEYHECRQDIQKWVDKRQWLYRTFVEITLIMLVSVLFLWGFPPESVKDFVLPGSIKESIQDSSLLMVPLLAIQRWVYELLVYSFPVIFKNFITYVVYIHPSIFIAMMITIVTLYKQRKKYLINQTKALAKTRKFVRGFL